MSTLTAVLIIAAAVAVFGPAVWWQFRAAARDEARKGQFIREHCRPPVLRVPPAPDNEQGINLADADECALIYSLPAVDPSWDAGLERLWDAARDEHTNTPEGGEL